jgi:hypothetical protein
VIGPLGTASAFGNRRGELAAAATAHRHSLALPFASTPAAAGAGDDALSAAPASSAKPPAQRNPPRVDLPNASAPQTPQG